MTDHAPVPDPEVVPDELRKRDQWLLWDVSSETPRRPHWHGNFGVSWSDPEDWHSFAEAVDTASEHDSWGIGYVFAADNPHFEDGQYGFFDLDSCLREARAEKPKDWVPQLDALLSGYVEYSAGEFGLHIPFERTTPDWWSNETSDDHEGPEAHTNKFCAFTGDVIDSCDPSNGIVCDDPAPFLLAAYEAWNGEYPDLPTAPGNGGDDVDDAADDYDADDYDEWLTDEDVADALDHLDPDMDMAEWWNIGRAIQDYDAGANGKRLYTEWSKTGSKWDDQAPDLLDWLWTESTAGTKTTVATLIHAAKQAGWDASAAARAATASDGGTAAANPNPDPDQEATDTAETETGSYTLALNPENVGVMAGLGEGGDVSDLNNRQMAACVWELIKQSDEFHVRVRRDNGSLWAYDGGVWKPEGERELRQAGRQALGAMNYGSKVLTQLKAQARADPTAEHEGDEFGLDPGVVAVENGLLDLDAAADGERDDAIRPLRPDDLALTRLPVEYDPDAGYDGWADYVAEWAEDGKADALQEHVGYCLEVGDLPIHRALLLVGSGANGKGTFLSVVRALLGRENTTSIELQTLANEKDAVADFYGAVANIDDDLSSRSLGKGLGMFKKLVGGDPVRARRLYEEGFQFRPTGKHLYAANEVPEVNVPDEDEAFWRRWLLVEFPNYYPPSERDHQLTERLTEPDVLSGVLNWAIEGRQRLLEQGSYTGEDHYAHQKRERWQAWGESVDKFISECVRRDPDAERLSTSDAHRRYAAWCREHDEDPVGQREFTNKLKNEDVGYGKHRIDGASTLGYKALGLSEDVPAVDDTPERGRRDDDLSGY